jgi:ribosomal protein L11 methyltransferase
VLDVGCGSGVLAVLAARLGARVDACDVDPAAVEATAENARANAVALAVRLGTLDGSGPEGGYDLIVANLLAPVLVTLAEPLRAVLAPGGVLVVSGLLDRRWSHVASALEPLVLVQVDHHEGWTALTLRTRREEPLPAR